MRKREKTLTLLNEQERSEICLNSGCNGWCCRVIGKAVNNDVAKEHFEQRGFEVLDHPFPENGDAYFMWLDMPCQHLQDGKCDVWDDENRNFVCKVFPGKYLEVMAERCPLMQALHDRGQI